MFKVNNKDTMASSGVFIVNNVVLASLLLTMWAYFTLFLHIKYSTPFISIVDYKQANAGWDSEQCFRGHIYIQDSRR